MGTKGGVPLTREALAGIRDREARTSAGVLASGSLNSINLEVRTPEGPRTLVRFAVDLAAGRNFYAGARGTWRRCWPTRRPSPPSAPRQRGPSPVSFTSPGSRNIRPSGRTRIITRRSTPSRWSAVWVASDHRAG
jgi:hypothetical protein